MQKKQSRKKIQKLLYNKCFFCENNNQNTLDLHRIIPGCQGGVYTPSNTIVECANCHRRTHSGEIVIDKKYTTTTGKTLVHYFENGKEYWKEEKLD